MDELEVDFTPLIDVTFLLLVFFMVTTTLAQPTSVKLPRAKSGTGAVVEDKLVVHLLPGDAADRLVRLGESESEPFPLSTLKAEVEGRLVLDVAMIRADEDVPFRYVDEVASTLRSIGFGKVLLGVKEREPVGAAGRKTR